MTILERVYSGDDIRNDFTLHKGFIKGVVDVGRQMVSLDADMHYQLADFMRETLGSLDEDLWGFKLYLDREDPDDILEFDSMINIRNNRLHGFEGGLGIEDPDTAAYAAAVIGRYIRL